MSFVSTEMVHVRLGKRKVGRLAIKGRHILFEYDPSFLESGLELSPFKLPLKPGVQSNIDGAFDGLFGLFNDSLPDGWGRLLQDRQLRQRSVPPEILTPLDRLIYVGAQGMGGLCYEPDYSGELPPSVVDLDQIARESMAVLEGDTSEVLAQLISLNGSSAGARPKIMVMVSDDKKRIASTLYETAEGTPWIIKFAAQQDQRDIGPIEYAYSLMAKAAGIIMPETHLFPSAKGGRYFGVRRFDRRGSERMHVHTVCGLLHADHRIPSLDYENILRATMHLTRSMPEVEVMFRLAVFNVLTHNRDDHSKNFSFVMEREGTWKVSPAYDLTFSSGPGGEHSTTVMGEGRNPTPEHLQTLGKKMNLAHSKEIIEQVKTAVSQWKSFAEAAGVSKESRDSIGKIIQAQT